STCASPSPRAAAPTRCAARATISAPNATRRRTRTAPRRSSASTGTAAEVSPPAGLTCARRRVSTSHARRASVVHVAEVTARERAMDGSDPPPAAHHPDLNRELELDVAPVLVDRVSHIGKRPLEIL